MNWRELKKLTKKNIEKCCQVIEKEENLLPEAIAIKYFPTVVERTKGAEIWDIDGNRFIDFLSSAAVYNIGHSHPAVVEAVKNHIEKIQNYTIVYFYNEEPVKLAELLTQSTPGDFPKKVAYGFSGSDSVDSAIKAARAFTGKKYIISFKHSYHGMTYGSLSATGIIDQETKKVICPDEHIVFAEYPDPYRNKWGIDGYAEPDLLSQKALLEIEKLIEDLQGDVAGVIIEPAQGDGGMIFPPAEFMKGLRTLTEEKNIVFIDEEVQTGMGRSGKMWAIEHYDVTPDVVVSAKALGGGMPLGAVIGRAEIMDAVPVPFFAYTHSGHSVNCAAAVAVLETLKKENLLQKAEERGLFLKEWFKEKASQYPFIGDVRGKGLLMGVEIVSDKASKTPDKATALKISWAAWERGLILITFGKNGNVLRVAPPINISDQLLEEALEIIDASFKDTAEGKVPDAILPCLKGW